MKRLIMFFILVIISMNIVISEDTFDRDKAIAQNLPKSELPTNLIRKCFDLTWNNDKYCLYSNDEEISLSKSLVNEILDQVETELTKHVSIQYFNEHFDLYQVEIKTMEELYYAAVQFEYNIGEYNFNYDKGYGYSLTVDSVQGVQNYIIPREIVTVVDKSEVESKARQCIGHKNLRYSIEPDFKISAAGEGLVIRYGFKIDLETGEFDCGEVREIAFNLAKIDDNEESSTRGYLPGFAVCYDCWYTYAILIFIILLITFIVKRKKS